MHPQGDCPVCGLLWRLRRDGTVGRHYHETIPWRVIGPNTPVCDGAYRIPVRHEGSSTVAIELAKLEG